MSVFKIRLRIGTNEFEAEGPPEVVVSELALFREALGMSKKAERPVELKTADAMPFDKMFRVHGRTLYTSIPIGSVEDAAFLLLLGQHRLRNNTAVSGTEIMEGLRASGHKIGRADHLLSSNSRKGYIIIRGSNRKRRYRLTNSGIQRAEKILAALPTPAN